MRTLGIRTAIFVLAVAIPTASGATERRSSLLVMRAQEPVAPGPMPVDPLPPDPSATVAEPAVTDVPSEPPTPAEPPTPEPPTTEATPMDREAMYMAARAEGTREVGVNAMVGTGLLTVGGVVLILAGFGATATALKRSDCETNVCATTDRKVANAARVTLAGLAISSIGGVAFIAAAAVYGAGNARVRRARGGSVPAIALAPSQRGAALSLRGRF